MYLRGRATNTPNGHPRGRHPTKPTTRAKETLKSSNTLATKNVPHMSRDCQPNVPSPFREPTRDPSSHTKTHVRLRRSRFRPPTPSVQMQRLLQIRPRRVPAGMATRWPRLWKTELLAMPHMRFQIPIGAYGLGTMDQQLGNTDCVDIHHIHSCAVPHGLRGWPYY